MKHTPLMILKELSLKNTVLDICNDTKSGTLLTEMQKKIFHFFICRFKRSKSKVGNSF